MDDDFLTALEVAKLLRVSTSTVKRWRREGTGPRYVTPGGVVRYRPADVQAWLDEHTVDPKEADE